MMATKACGGFNENEMPICKMEIYKKHPRKHEDQLKNRVRACDWYGRFDNADNM